MRLTKENLRINPVLVNEKITRFIKTVVEQASKKGVVLGLSGGIDSSTVATLCVSALGADNVLGLIMPSTTTILQDVEDAKLIAKRLGIQYELINIIPIEEKFSTICHHYDPANLIGVGNLKPRVRMTVLYYHANSLNNLVVGTGNKSELMIGYYTKYGDGGADILPLGDLYKTQVKFLAEYLEVPKNIIQKTPSAGLWIGQTDEEEIGIKYEVLDLILYGSVELNMPPLQIAGDVGVSFDTVNRVLNMVKMSEHKRASAPVVKVQTQNMEA